jgi:hypothetical protein
MSRLTKLLLYTAIALAVAAGAAAQTPPLTYLPSDTCGTSCPFPKARMPEVRVGPTVRLRRVAPTLRLNMKPPAGCASMKK